jgi:hypothetical protein
MKLKHSPATMILVLGGFLMFVDTLLAWQSVDVGDQTFTRNAWHGFWGVILGLLSIAFLANVVTQFGIIELKLKLPHRLFSIILAPAILVFAVIKNIDDSHSGWASYAGIVLAALITYGAWLGWKEKPGKEKAEPPAALPAAPGPERSQTERSGRQ